MLKRILSKFRKASVPKSSSKPWANDPIWKFWKTHPTDKAINKDSFVSALKPADKTRFRK